MAWLVKQTVEEFSDVMWRQSNKEPGEMKCSLEQSSISALSDILYGLLRTHGGSSVLVLFPYIDFIVNWNFKGLLKLFEVLVENGQLWSFLIGTLH